MFVRSEAPRPSLRRTKGKDFLLRSPTKLLRFDGGDHVTGVKRERATKIGEKSAAKTGLFGSFIYFSQVWEPWGSPELDISYWAVVKTGGDMGMEATEARESGGAVPGSATSKISTISTSKPGKTG